MFAWMIVTNIYTTELARAANKGKDEGGRMKDESVAVEGQTLSGQLFLHPSAFIPRVCPSVLTACPRSYYIGTLP
jgi:hypothetical protein